jgi:methionyl-tRNA formyltransferase
LRIAILANTLPGALPIYEELQRADAHDLVVILCPVSSRAGAREWAKHAARLLLKPRRFKSFALLSKGKVKTLRHALDHPRSSERLAKLKLDVGLHKTGNIYRQTTIDCFRLGILNAHIGLLPGYRGRSVMEWSVLQGDPVGISVFLIDSGIDTGERIILSEQVDISRCRSLTEAKQYLFSLDALFYRRAVALLSSNELTCKRNDLSGRRYYVMSKLFNEAAEKIFSLHHNP